MKTILITGGAGGLGRSVVQLFLEKGHQLIALVQDEKDKEQLPSHNKLHAEVADLAKEEQVASIMAALINRFKKIDAAVLLAGGYAGGTLETTSIKNIQEQIKLNFETAYTVVRSLYPHFLQGGYGRFILTGAQPPLMPKKAKSALAYTLSKSLLFQLAAIINEETKGTNIVATVIVPSTIDTKANREAMPDADANKWVKPEQIAGIIEFALSDKADALREPVLKIYNQVS